MKVILNVEKIEEEFSPKYDVKKRGNPLKLNDDRAYLVKDFAKDAYGSFLKLAGIQKPFATKWFYVSEIGKTKVYAKADVYAITEDGITADTTMKETLNVVSDIGFQQECEITMAFYSDTLGEWVFDLKGYKFPVLHRHMEITRIVQ